MTTTKTADRAAMVHALLNPRNVAIVGASDKPGAWPERVYRNLRHYGYAGAIYPLNPTRDEIWGIPCFKRFADMPEAPDHLVILSPAKTVPAALRDGAAAGARSATIMSSGFDEATSEQGRALAADLAAAIAETGLAVSGPNCMGNFNHAAKFFTMTDDRPHRFVDGPVAVFGQSGGIVMAMKRTLEERGIVCGALITSGNEAGLTSADYISYFADVPSIRVIVCYLESTRDPQAFLAACRKARAAGKPVVVAKLGLSEEGQRAAAAHTGALAGSMAAFDAVASEAGVVRVRNLDDVVEATELLAHTRLPRGGRPGSITFSGGMRGLLLDMAQLNGVTYPALAPETRARLDKILGVGTIVGNPLDSGFTGLSSQTAYLECVHALLDDPHIDILLLQEELSRAPGNDRKESNMRKVNEIAATATKPIAFVSMISYGLTDYSRALRDELRNVAFLQECDKALRAIAAVGRYVASINAPPVTPPAANVEGKALLARFVATPGPSTLDEVASKQLLALYGIKTPREETARNEDEAAAAAARIGYPVVLKAISADLPHKSDAGGVALNLKSEAEVRAAWRKIAAALAAHPAKPKFEGALVAQMVSGGLELVLGVKRDPEMGSVVLFGSGGVDLELTKDVALAAAPLDEVRANALIDSTRVATLIKGYRGRPALDRAALVEALIGLSRVAHDAGDAIAEIDVNPFLLMEKGSVALDGLVVLERALG
jgi:acyl-CoA synthetase (NDP forming)